MSTSGEQRILSERVEYGGRTFRICSETRVDEGQIATTLELGHAVLMSKMAPYNPTLEADAIDRVLEGENRRVRERLLAGDLDAWVTAGEVDRSPSRAAAPRRPGRWAVKVGMVEKPFKASDPMVPSAGHEGWDTAPAGGAAPRRTSQPPKTEVRLPSRPPVTDGLPRLFGPYRLIEHAGRSRYLAVGGGGGAERAVSLVTIENAGPELSSYARGLLRVEHGSIVPVLEVGAAGDVLFCASPLLDGRDADTLLSRAVSTARPLPLDVVTWIVREVARGLEVLHAGGRVHGAIGLGAVFLGYDGEVRLGGLGEGLLARPRPQTTDDVAALGTLLLALLGRGPGMPESGARAKFVPPVLLSIASRSRAEPGTQSPLRSAQAVAAALTAYLTQDAPRTDAGRVARLMADVFPAGAQEDAARRESLIERARALPVPADPQPTPPIEDPEPTTDPERPPGTIIDGRYCIQRLCGRGGMGWVYEAEHQAIGRKVALKILHPFYSRSHDIAERFRREARAASKIGHPNIADVFDFGNTSDGCLYIAMEFLDGRDLGHLLEEAGQLEVDRALRITTQVCRALEAAHAAGVVHRDLKPENVFLLERPGNADFVKVLDFGIAKYVEDPPEEKLTRPNIALGTPEYMAPEQVSGKVEPRSDIYAVGAMLYEMLVGTPPFEGENYLEVFRRKALEDPLPPSQFRDDVAPAVEQLIMRALARIPDGRPASMAAMAGEIDRLL